MVSFLDFGYLGALVVITKKWFGLIIIRLGNLMSCYILNKSGPTTDVAVRKDAQLGNKLKRSRSCIMSHRIHKISACEEQSFHFKESSWKPMAALKFEGRTQGDSKLEHSIGERRSSGDGQSSGIEPVGGLEPTCLYIDCNL